MLFVPTPNKSSMQTVGKTACPFYPAVCVTRANWREGYSDMSLYSRGGQTALLFAHNLSIKAVG